MAAGPQVCQATIETGALHDQAQDPPTPSIHPSRSDLLDMLCRCSCTWLTTQALQSSLHSRWPIQHGALAAQILTDARPCCRGKIEGNINAVSRGQRTKDDVLQEAVTFFKADFLAAQRKQGKADPSGTLALSQSQHACSVIVD